MSRLLDVYLRETRVGILKQDEDANLSFTYVDKYLESNAPKPVSVSMPLVADTYDNKIAKPFFSGLLPDESSRTRLANALGLSDSNSFGMLEVIGGECAGALALHPHGVDVDLSKADDEVINEQQLFDLLAELRGNPLLGGRRDIRLSLAGAQDKLAVKLDNDKIVLVKNGGPTTHILKPGIKELDGTAENEAFCMSLARRCNLQTPAVRFARAKNTSYVLVERFDRHISKDNLVQRLHQEDFCQALSVAPELKYEDEGGPGVTDSLGLIQRVTNQPAADRLRFMQMLIFHYLVGNADAHAKNFALLHALDSNAPSLAPMYDVLCTSVYPQLTSKCAMRIGNRNVPDTIKLKQWMSLVPDTKAAQNLLIKQINELADTIVAEADQLYADSVELGFQHPVLKEVLKLIKKRAKHVRQSS